MVRKARERYERYKWDILETGPDFRPFVTHEGFFMPDPVNSLGGPMDLTYVRQVIKESVHMLFRKDMLNLHTDPLDGSSQDMFHLMPRKNWFWT